MGHLSLRGYLNLQHRLDKAPQGVPDSKILVALLSELFSEEEARLTAKLPFGFFTAKQAAKKSSLNSKEITNILASLAKKGIVFDFVKDDISYYFLVPTMAGFFEFSLMRSGNLFNKKLLSELYYKYINQENGLASQLFQLDPPFGRTITQEDLIEEADRTEVLDYEKLSYILNSASEFAVGRCYCRHKMEHLGKKCIYPQDVCLTLNACAEVLIKNGVAQRITKKEAVKKVEQCIDLGLAQYGDNVQSNVSFICNCCPCCCEAANVYKRFYNGSSVSASNFIAQDVDQRCNGCGICKAKCPVDAIYEITLNNKKVYKVDQDKCLGCGVCVRFCPKKDKILKRREEINYTPVDMFERIIISAINSGKLQNYLFDSVPYLNFKILNKLVAVILCLPAAKKLFAIRQTRSIFLNVAAHGQTGKLFHELYVKGERSNYSHQELIKNNF